MIASNKGTWEVRSRTGQSCHSDASWHLACGFDLGGGLRMGTEQNRDRHDELHCSFDRRSTSQWSGIFMIQQKKNSSRWDPMRNCCSHDFFSSECRNSVTQTRCCCWKWLNMVESHSRLSANAKSSCTAGYASECLRALQHSANFTVILKST